MSRPKNSTVSSSAQQTLKTNFAEFSTIDGENRHPFAVQEGIPVAEALNFAYGLLAAANRIATTCIDQDPDVQDLVALRFLMLASQALVLSSVSAVEQGGGA
jgi:hypothetical protein